MSNKMAEEEWEKKGKSVTMMTGECGLGWAEGRDSLNYSTNMRPLYADFSVFS